MTKSEKPSFLDMIEGRQPPPPAARLLGWRLLELDAEAGRIKVEFNGREEFLNPAGTIQGGLLSAMLDDTMGPAAMSFLGGKHMAQTLELKVNFMRPGRVGRILGEGHVAHAGRDILFLEGRLTDDQGKVLATATATCRVVGLS
jgi:uncharacterized protein (TIGR00369 family)